MTLNLWTGLRLKLTTSGMGESMYHFQDILFILNILIFVSCVCSVSWCQLFFFFFFFNFLNCTLSFIYLRLTSLDLKNTWVDNKSIVSSKVFNQQNDQWIRSRFTHPHVWQGQLYRHTLAHKKNQILNLHNHQFHFHKNALNVKNFSTSSRKCVHVVR